MASAKKMALFMGFFFFTQSTLAFQHLNTEFSDGRSAEFVYDYLRFAGIEVKELQVPQGSPFAISIVTTVVAEFGSVTCAKTNYNDGRETIYECHSAHVQQPPE